MCFKADVSLMIFCLVDLSIDVSGVLKPHSMIALLFIPPLYYLHLLLLYIIRESTSLFSLIIDRHHMLSWLHGRT